MGKFTGKACRLVVMLGMTFGFFLVELVVGYTTGSLALVADSFHMLSDVVALIVGLLSVRVSFDMKFLILHFLKFVSGYSYRLDRISVSFFTLPKILYVAQIPCAYCTFLLNMVWCQAS